MDRNESRFILTPNPVALTGQKNMALDLRPGESLYSFLHRHVPGLDEGKWIAVINGNVVERQDWFTTFPKDGQLIELRGDVAGKSVLMIVAMVALTIFTFGIGAAAAFSVYGAMTAAGFGAMGATLAATAVYMVGAMLIQKVLGPKQETPAAQDTSSRNSLSGTNNRMRPYEPFGLLFGENVRIAPDVLSRPYGYFEGDEQYMDMILTPGFNVDSIGPFMNGTTPLLDYQDVKVYHNNFSGMPSVDIPMMTNTLELPGGRLSADDKGTPGPIINRTTGQNTIKFMVGISYTLYGVTRKGKDSYNQETVRVMWRKAGTTNWNTRDFAIRNIDKKEHRVNWTFDVEEGTWDIQVQALGRNSTGNSDQQSFQLTSIITVRPDTTDYSYVPRVGINMKATGQLNGAPNELTCLATAKPTQVWNGTAWETKHTSNPGAQILQYLRGIYSDKGELLAGMGLPDEEINIESLKAFMLHCARNKFEYRFWITDKRSHENVIQSIANCAMGQMTTAGGLWTATWAAEDQPFTGVVNMATMTDASFEVSYTMANAADGIEYAYYDPTTEKVETVRVKSPDSDPNLEPLNPATVSGEGVTDPEHAAKMARYFLGQSLYQYKDISYGTSAEALSYRRMDRLMLQHDLTQWGFGGRVVSAVKLPGGRVEVTLDEKVPPFPTPYLGIRALGERTCRVFNVVAFTEPTNVITLKHGVGGSGDVWPADMPFPVPGTAPNFIWMYDFKSTPGYPVRVVSIEADYDCNAKVAVVWEGPEFWNYVYRGVYERPDNASSLPQKVRADNLRARDYQVVQGDTTFTEVQLQWDVTGSNPYSHVYMAGEDGVLMQVGSNLTTRSHTVRLDHFQAYTFVVTPYGEDFKPGVSARLDYRPQTMGFGPALVDYFDVIDQDGGIRKYDWGFFDTTTITADFVGVNVRHILAVDGTPKPAWETMEPVGNNDGFHSTAFEAVIPKAGKWTFAIRSLNSAGVLSDEAIYVTKTLGKNIGEFHNETTQDIVDLFNKINDEAQQRIDDIKEVTDKISKETQDRIDADKTEADARKAEVTRLEGDIATNVQSILNEKLERVAAIEAEAVLRQTGDDSLAYQISQISAGTGTQFDSKKIWYFDTTNEGWTGTAANGFLDPGTAVAQSPSGLGVNGAEYRYIKMRVQRDGNPVWKGEVTWTLTDGTTGSAIMDEPQWDVNGIGTVDLVDIPWATGELDHFSLQLGNSVDATNKFLYDWIAVGRPTPGASVAMVQDETKARVQADLVEAQRRETLAVQMRGDYTGTDAAAVTTGLLFSEKTLRIDGDRILGQRIDTMQIAQDDLSVKITDETQARIDGDTALGLRITNLSAEVDGKASAAALQSLETRVENTEDGLVAVSESVQKLDAQLIGTHAGDGTDDAHVGDPDVYAGNLSVYTAIADATHAMSRQVIALNAEFGDFKSEVNSELLAMSTEVSALGREVTDIKVQLNGKASAQALQLLEARVDENENGVAVNADAITRLTGQVAGKAEASAVSALQIQVTDLNGKVNANSTAINQVNARVDGKAEASVVQQLSATVSTQDGRITAINAQYFLSVDAGGRVGGMKIGNNGQTVDFTVLSDKFVITSPVGGRRLEYSNGNIRVYDENNRLRVRMGVW